MEAQLEEAGEDWSGELAALRSKRKDKHEATTIPMEQRDVVIQAVTGCGKTLAFLLPILANIDNYSPRTQAVIMVPTHELTIQIYNLATKLNAGGNKKRKDNPIVIRRMSGRINPREQAEYLKYPPHIIIGTPHTLREAFFGGRSRCLDIHRINYLVVDEADHVCEPFAASSLKPFLEALKYCEEHPDTHERFRTIFCSAHMTKHAHQIIATHLKAPIWCTGRQFNAVSAAIIAQEQNKRLRSLLPRTLSHYSIRCLDFNQKLAHLTRLWSSSHRPRVFLVFIKASADLPFVAEALMKKKFRVAALVNASSKTERKEALEYVDQSWHSMWSSCF